MTPIAPHITAFFQKRLAVELRASQHTCDTYAYAFRLLLEFMSRKLGVAPADLALEARQVIHKRRVRVPPGSVPGCAGPVDLLGLRMCQVCQRREFLVRMS